MKKEILRMERVTYKEEETTYLKDFELNVFSGEIVGLLPVNAYGLPQLLSVLRENPLLYAGYMYYKERLVNSWQNLNSWQAGKNYDKRIAVISDQTSLVEGQSVLTNIFILRQGFRQELIRKKLLKSQLQPFLDEIEVEIEADTLVEKLSSFERLVVELLRAVVADYRLIVMREIGTLVNEGELEKIHAFMKHYAKQGFSFLYISPHFEEILQICGRAVVMSNGKVIKALAGEQMQAQTLNFYSEEYNAKVRHHIESLKERQSNKIVFEGRHLCGDVIFNFNLKVAQGECVVIQSLEEGIFRDLYLLFQGEKQDEIHPGTCYLEGRASKICGDRGIAFIREEPTETMLFYDMSYMDNLCIAMDHRVKNIWGNRKMKRCIRADFEEILGENVFDKRMQELTEMEKYDLVYTRIMLQKPKIVFCVQPFKGADLRHRIHIWELQEKLLRKGIAVVILAVNMADALSLADRLVRIDKGTVVTEYQRKDFGMLPRNIPWKALYDENGRIP